jgi:hypothetical protein
MRKSVVLLILITAFCIPAHAQLLPITQGLGNYTGVDIYYDSTQYTDDMAANQQRFQKISYAKKGWRLDFPYDIFALPSYPPDTVFALDYTMLSDTNMINVFDSITNTFGAFTMTKIVPAVIDSEYMAGCYALEFPDLHNVDSVLTILQLLPNASSWFISYITFPISIPNDRSLKPRTPLEKIDNSWSPGGAPSFYPQNFHTRGWSSHHYSIKTPLAWEISEGDPTTVVAAYDILGCDPISYTDLVLRNSSAGSGNWITIQNVQYDKRTGTSGTAKKYGTNPPSFEVSSNWPAHGIQVIGAAVARSDNDSPSDRTSAFAGTCPECYGIGFFNPCYGGSEIDNHGEYANVDCDLSLNGAFLPVSVVNFSWTGMYHDCGVKTLLDAGIIVVGAAGNKIFRAVGSSSPDGYWEAT